MNSLWSPSYACTCQRPCTFMTRLAAVELRARNRIVAKCVPTEKIPQQKYLGQYLLLKAAALKIVESCSGFLHTLCEIEDAEHTRTASSLVCLLTTHELEIPLNAVILNSSQQMVSIPWENAPASSSAELFYTNLSGRANSRKLDAWGSCPIRIQWRCSLQAQKMKSN